MISRTLIASVLTATLAVSSVAAAPLETLAPDQLRPGQKAVVRTVFQGHKVEEFEAEIVGVLQGGRAEGDLIIGRALSDRVKQSGVAQGMSGSPVYVDGKLIGALSSGWPFSREPVFGITPIREMMGVLSLPTVVTESSAGPSGAEGAAATGARFRAFRWDDDEASLPAPIANATPSSSTRFRALPLPLACGGLNPGAMDLARRWLEPLGFSAVPGGVAAAGGPSADSLQAGSAVAVDLMRGDLQISAIGTVTYRDGDRVLLFGHPFFQSGAVRLPMATAEITTVIASDLFSFKLGARGREAGVVTQDRRAALAGQMGGSPRMTPVSVQIRGGGRTQSFRFESIEDRAIAPNLIALACLNSLLESGGMGSNQTLRWSLELHRAGALPLTITDVEASESPATDAAGGIAAPIAFLLNNPFGRLTLDSVAVQLEVEPKREQWTLRGARMLEAAARPGEQLRVRCELEQWRGGRVSHDLAIDIPEELPNGRYVLWLGGGAELSRYEAQRLPGRYRPTSLDDAWRRLGQARGAEALHAALFARAPEVTAGGRDYPELPVSALAVLAGDQRAGDQSRRGDLARLDEVAVTLDGLVRGELQLMVQVDSKAP